MPEKKALLKTNQGDIEIVLFEDQAPVTVANFIQYIDDGHYQGTIFHRVIPNFMIQGGGYDEQFQQKPTRPPIKNEAQNGFKNERGTLAMARTSEIDSATSQFFINLANNSFLDHGQRDFGYAVFGKVTAGMDVVDKIAALPTGAAGPFSKDCPVQPVVIESVQLL